MNKNYLPCPCCQGRMYVHLGKDRCSKCRRGVCPLCRDKPAAITYGLRPMVTEERIRYLMARADKQLPLFEGPEG